MSMFRLLVRISQHLWRQVPLSTLPGGESPNSVLSCSVAFNMLIVESQTEEENHDSPMEKSTMRPLKSFPVSF